MTKNDKLVKRLRRRPTDFTINELDKLLNSMGFEKDNKGMTSGSRVKYLNREKGITIMIHTPHPANTLKMYVIDNIIDTLTKNGLL